MVLGAFTDFFWIGQAGQVNVRNDAFVLSASPRYPVEFSLGKFDLATTEIAETFALFPYRRSDSQQLMPVCSPAWLRQKFLRLRHYSD